MRTRLGLAAAAGGCLFFVVNGLWAFAFPRSFFNNVAPWSPYNEHFLRDAGSFSLGVGVALVMLFVRQRSGICALAGAAVAAAAHAVSHVIDYGRGGRDSDPYLLGLFAFLLVIALIREVRAPE
jgi:uncharacterized protein YjeT (DUF2065 family)